MKINANQKRQAQAMKSRTKDTDLNIIWNHGIVIIESHQFTPADALKLKAAVRAQRSDYPKLQTGRMTDTVAAEYADYCAKDLRRASAFIDAIWKHDVSSMIANEFKFKYADQPNAFSSWCMYGSLLLMYILYVSKLMDYLRVAHPNLAEVWEQRIKPLVTNAMNAQSSDGRSKLGDGYTVRIVTYLNSAANQIDEVRNALAKIVEKPSVVSQGAASRGEPLPQPELVRKAGLEGPYAMQKPMAQLLAKLRSEPDTWQSVFILCGRKKGKAHSDAKKNLESLKKKRLAEKESDGERWRLGAAAFPDKGATKGATI